MSATCGRPNAVRRASVENRAAVIALALMCASVLPAGAQSALRVVCQTTPAPEPSRQLCMLSSYAAETLMARTGIVSAAGNPVQGTASTLGMALGPLPAMALSARLTGVWLELPPIGNLASTSTPDGLAVSLNVDGTLGIYQGRSLTPTIGGFLSVDLLASAGIRRLPGATGLDSDMALAWAGGARVGIMRESFRAPGISLSAMYRRPGSPSFGEAALSATDAFVDVGGLNVVSLRAGVSKRITLLGLAAGVGYDLHSADVRVLVRNPGLDAIDAFEEGFRTNRLTAFGNGSMTFLILTLAAELGWQQGGDTPRVRMPAGDVSGRGAVYGSLAIRLTI